MFERIESQIDVLGGKPCVRGTRISVEFVVELMASGASREDILREYPCLTAEDVAEALQYAARFLKNEVVLSAKIPS